MSLIGSILPYALLKTYWQILKIIITNGVSEKSDIRKKAAELLCFWFMISL